VFSSSDTDEVEQTKAAVKVLEQEKEELKKELELLKIEVEEKNLMLKIKEDNKAKAAEYAQLNDRMNKSIQEKEALQLEMDNLQAMVCSRVVNVV
jgi:chromosome segregation ATPase